MNVNLVNLPDDWELACSTLRGINAGEWTLTATGEPFKVTKSSIILHVIIRESALPKLVFPASLLFAECAGMVMNSDCRWYLVSKKPDGTSFGTWNFNGIFSQQVSKNFHPDLPELKTHFWDRSWVPKPQPQTVVHYG